MRMLPDRSYAALLLLLAAPTMALSQVTLSAPRTTTLSTTAIVEPAGPPPTNVRAGPTPTSINIRWTCPSGATGYEVYATPTGGAQVKLTPTPIPPQCVQEYLLQQLPDARLPVPTSSEPTYGSSFNHTGLAVGTEYSYVVRALYATGISDAAPLAARTTAWPAPSGVTVALSATRSGTLTWNRIDGVSGYHVFRKMAGEPAFLKLTTMGAAWTSYDDRTLLPPGQHQYYVQAVDGIAGAPITLTAGPWPAPKNLTVSEQYVNIVVRWDFVQGTNSYLVFRQLQGTTGFAQITPTPVNTNGFVDNTVPRGQTHKYYVQAVNGEPSAPVSFAAGRAGTVTFEKARGNPVVTFRWSGATGANVTLWRSASAQGPFVPLPVAVDPAVPATIQDRAATVGATQHYKLLFGYQAGTLESDVLAVTIAPPPKGVTGLTATPQGNGIRLSWACDYESSGYRIMRGKDRQALDWIRPYGSTTPLLVKECSYTDENLFSGSTYTYTVFGNYSEPNTLAPNGTVSAKVP